MSCISRHIEIKYQQHEVGFGEIKAAELAMPESILLFVILMDKDSKIQIQQIQI